VPSHRVLPSPCYIVSDHHLGTVPGQAERDFLTFLEDLRGKAGALVINGDLFDFWFEWRTVVPRVGFRVLASLAAMTADGTPIVWIAGNHDCWGGDVLRDEVGVDYLMGPWEGTMAGWRTRIEHGDGMRPVGDRGYRALRSVIRHPAAITAMRWLHPDVGVWLARRSSSASRDHRARDGGAELRSLAMQRLAGDNAPELYVLGHNHVAALERSPQGGVYANAGSWSEGGTHLLVTANNIELRSWTGSAGNNRLNAIDRNP
jgi:UDP-2,3-diacylglucosamine hydrolase